MQSVKRITTPEGELEYSFFFKPDNGPEGKNAKPKLKGTIILDESAEGVKEIVDTITQASVSVHKAAMEEYEIIIAKMKAEKSNKALPAKPTLYNPVKELAGGRVKLTPTLDPNAVNSKGEKFNKVLVWDTKNKPWDEALAIWNGSKGRFIIDLVPFTSPAFGSGVSLRLREVQVTSLVTRGSQSGFGAPQADEAPTGFGSTETHGADF